MEEFKHLNPKKLEYCLKGYKLKKKMEDEIAWAQWGNYGISALVVALDHGLRGRKAKSKYIDRAVMSDGEIKSSSYQESNEQIAIYEMKQRIKMLREEGLPESPD